MLKTHKYLLLFFIVFSVNGQLAAQISPGELTHAHANLEGLSNCTKCHVLGEKETSSKCLACHTEIKLLIDQKKGYHASNDVKGKRCAECHGEHFGRDFQIVRFSQDNFNHNLAGFKLEGKHATVKCTDCHQPGLISKKVSQKKNKHTFLGLGTECLSCHEDVHQNTLSKTCTSCHNQDAFKPATGFDHSTTSFALRGKHVQLDCAKCHVKTIKNGKDFQEFAGVAFANCTNCHQDVHQNKFGSDCTKCHNEFSFKTANVSRNFNHDKTDYPLLGKHLLVDCKACHTSGTFTTTISHKKCTDCHRDYHEGQLIKNGISPDCAECHSVNGFTTSSFTLEKHNQTEFALEGAHLATPCLACHKSAEKWNFNIPDRRCIACHNNIHENILDDKYMPQSDCKFCHSAETWNEISFDHNRTNFQLLGKHAQASCRDCHFKEANGTVKQQFASLATSCENCHQDIHFKQFEVLGKNDCGRCHTFSNWLPDKFNHDNTRFKLDGKHQGLQCTACHKPTDSLIRNYVIYKFEDISCASCH